MPQMTSDADMLVNNEPVEKASAIEAHRGRTAVIAIHGVGEHQSGAMAKEVAAQLQRVNYPSYGRFGEAHFSVVVTAEDLGIHGDAAKPRGLSRLMSGFRSHFERTATQKGVADPIDIAFTRSLLAGAEPTTATYETLCLNGTRSDGAEPERDIDIFELYWSDLSHPGKTTLSLFHEIFLLVIHAASLGRTTAATLLPTVGARAKPLWTVFYWLNAASYWLLSMPILIGNFLLALAGLLIVPVFIGRKHASGMVAGAQETALLADVVAGLCGLTVAGLLAFAAYRGLRGRALKLPAAFLLVGGPLLAGAVTAAIIALALPAPSDHQNMYLPLFCAGLEILPLAVIGDYLMRGYDQSRPGALLLWRVMGGALLIWIAGVGFWRWSHLFDKNDPSGPLLQWLGYSVEGWFVLLVVAWLALYLSNIALCLTAFVLTIRQRNARDCEYYGPAELRRSIATCLLAASLPAPLFLAIVLTIWALVFNYLLLPLPSEYFCPQFSLIFDQHVDSNEFVSIMIDKSANGLALIYAIMMLIVMGLIVWALLPSIYRELFPGDVASTRPSLSASRFLGGWLDGAFQIMSLAGLIAGLGFFLVFPMGSVASLFPRLHGIIDFMPLLFHDFGTQRSFVKWTGYFAGGTTLGFMAGTRLLSKTVSGAVGKVRVIIDIMLDVDCWLRESPVGGTPRLKIFARFASLLREIPMDRYSHVVIVAHSQGTVVATDFFRYLHAIHSPLVDALPPVTMLSVGSPLRQLYASRFPVLYNWVLRAPAAEAMGPDPGECGFARWINAYGSADYVGRSLWKSDDDPARWDPGHMSGSTGHMHHEFCVGAAAHTHYLDADNTLVGQCLHELL